MNSRHNRSSGFENPWFVFGVSYAGALSAWFRLKFPHLTCGSLASSGVVLAVYNFTDFDKQVCAHYVWIINHEAFTFLWNELIEPLLLYYSVVLFGLF